MPVIIKDLPRRLQRVVLERAPWASLETPIQAAFVFHRQPEGAEYWWRVHWRAERRKQFKPFIITGAGILLWALVAALTEVITYAR